MADFDELRGTRSGGPVPGAKKLPVPEATELTGQSARDVVRGARTARAPSQSTATFYGTPEGVATSAGDAEAARRAAQWQQSAANPAMHGDGRYGAPPNPPEGWTPPNSGPQPEARARGGFSFSPRSAGEAAGDAIKSGLRSTAPLARQAGEATGRLIKSNVNPITSAVDAVAGHGNAYFDSDVSLRDKARIFGTDAVHTGGTAAGAAYGAGLGAQMMPGNPYLKTIGGLAGALVGGYFGSKHGQKAGDAAFGGDDAQRRNGYDPERGIGDVAGDLIAGKGSAAYGGPARRPDGLRTAAELGDTQLTPVSEKVNLRAQYEQARRAQPTAAGPGDADAEREMKNAAMLKAAGDAQAADRPQADASGAGAGLRGGGVIRNGNSFNGVNVGEGFSYGGDGAPNGSRQRSDQVMPRSDQVMPRPDGYDSAMAREQRYVDALKGMADVQRGIDQADHGGPGMVGLRDTRVADYEKFARGADINSALSHMGSSQRAKVLAELRKQDIDEAAQQSALEMQRYATSQHDATTRRGQDLTFQNGLRSNQIQWLNQQREQANKDRQYQFEVGKDERDYGAQQVERNRAAAESANKDWQGLLENRFRTTDDKGNSVADGQKIASFNTAADGTLPEMIRKLRATGTKAALAKAAELSSRGRAALGPEDFDHLKKLYDKRELIRQSHGMLPGSSDYVHSDNLYDYLDTAPDKHLIGEDGVRTRNGSKVRLGTLRGQNNFLPSMSPPNTNLTGLRARDYQGQ